MGWRTDTGSSVAWMSFNLARVTTLCCWSDGALISARLPAPVRRYQVETGGSNQCREPAVCTGELLTVVNSGTFTPDCDLMTPERS